MLQKVMILINKDILDDEKIKNKGQGSKNLLLNYLIWKSFKQLARIWNHWIVSIILPNEAVEIFQCIEFFEAQVKF